MPKFTITSNNSDGPKRHKEVLEFPSTKAATDDAQIALADMARDELPDGKRADFGVQVEDKDGKEVYRAGLHFEAKTDEDMACENKKADAAADDVASYLAPRKRE